jgi:TctA family transporter
MLACKEYHHRHGEYEEGLWVGGNPRSGALALRRILVCQHQLTPDVQSVLVANTTISLITKKLSHFIIQIALDDNMYIRFL